MTRSRFNREMPEAERSAIALDSIYEYLRKNHPEHAAQIALRMTYRLAVIWKGERDLRLAANPNDPRRVFNMSDQYLHSVRNLAAALPPPTQSEVLAERYATLRLAEFKPDCAWLTSRNLHRQLAFAHDLDLLKSPVAATKQVSAPLNSDDKAQ
jgi:hypothetical protein